MLKNNTIYVRLLWDVNRSASPRGVHLLVMVRTPLIRPEFLTSVILKPRARGGKRFYMEIGFNFLDIRSDCMAWNLRRMACLRTLHHMVVQRPHTPWINPEILQAKLERSRLERCWRRWKSPFDRKKFRAQCNSVRSLISKAKSSFLSNLVTESTANPRTLWKTLNTILHRNPSNSLPESPDASSLANTFLDFFKDKIDRIRTKFLPSRSPDPFLFPPRAGLKYFGALG